MIQMATIEHTGKVVRALMASGAKRATLFISPSQRVSAQHTGRLYRNSRSHSIVVSFGAPNYAEREFIRKCRKAGEPFPVKKVQLKFAPVKGRAK